MERFKWIESKKSGEYLTRRDEERVRALGEKLELSRLATMRLALLELARNVLGCDRDQSPAAGYMTVLGDRLKLTDAATRRLALRELGRQILNDASGVRPLAARLAWLKHNEIEV